MTSSAISKWYSMGHWVRQEDAGTCSCKSVVKPLGSSLTICFNSDRTNMERLAGWSGSSDMDQLEAVRAGSSRFGG